jgi:hypothetical protein
MLHYTTRTKSDRLPKPGMNFRYSDTFSPSSFSLAESLVMNSATRYFVPEQPPTLNNSTTARGSAANDNTNSRQRVLHGHKAVETSKSHHGNYPMAHPEGHSDQFPAPPKAWECCGCKQKFYNFEKQCSFCATTYCKDCRKIPWK